MTVQLERIAGAPMAAELHVRDHVLRIDASVPEGGEDTGPNPHDLYDAALASCKALTVLWYARHKGWTIHDLQTSVVRDATQERAGTYKLAVQMKVQSVLPMRNGPSWSVLQTNAPYTSS